MSTTNVSVRDLMDAGCHFGHSRGRRHPNMAEYVYITREKINIINLEKTKVKLEELLVKVEEFVAAGNALVLVGTKRQAKDIIETIAKAADLPYVSERWLGGTLTNFDTVKKSIKRMNDLGVFLESNDSEELTKRERLMQQRDLDRLKIKFGGLAKITAVPDGLFVIDPSYEKNAVKEAKSLDKKVFALLDTNSNPLSVDEFVPANDDANKSILLIMNEIAGAIEAGQKRAKTNAIKAEKEAIKVAEAKQKEREQEKVKEEKARAERDAKAKADREVEKAKREKEDKKVKATKK